MKLFKLNIILLTISASLFISAIIIFNLNANRRVEMMNAYVIHGKLSYEVEVAKWCKQNKTWVNFTYIDSAFKINCKYSIHENQKLHFGNSWIKN